MGEQVDRLTKGSPTDQALTKRQAFLCLISSYPYNYHLMGESLCSSLFAKEETVLGQSRREAGLAVQTL